MKYCNSSTFEGAMPINDAGYNTRGVISDLQFENHLAKLAAAKANRDRYKQFRTQLTKEESLC